MSSPIFKLLKTIMRLGGLILSVFSLGSCWESVKPEYAFWLKDGTSYYSEDIQFAKEKLKFIGINCDDSEVKIYDDPVFTFGDNYSGTVNPKKVSLLKTDEMNFKALRIILFQKIADSCSSKKTTLSNNSNKLKAQSLKHSKANLELIKKNGLKQSCYKASFVDGSVCRTTPYDGSSLSENESVISYNDIKTNLDEMIDIEDTYDALEQNPLDFQKNFTEYFSNEYQFKSSF